MEALTSPQSAPGRQASDEVTAISGVSDSALLESPLSTASDKPPVEPHVSLVNLPQELILDIVDAIFDDYKNWEIASALPLEQCRHRWESHQIQVWRDIANLAATCKSLSARITPALYKADAVWNYSSALLRSAKKGNVSGILKSLDHGAEIDMMDMTAFVTSVYIREIGWDPDPRYFTLMMTSLRWASYYQHVDAMTALLQRGADPNDRAGPATIDFENKILKGLPSRLPDKMPTLKLEQHVKPLADYFSSRCEAFRSLSFGTNALYYTLIGEYYAPNMVETFRQCYSRREINCSYQKRRGSRMEAVKVLIQAGVSLDTHLGTGLHALHQVCGDCDVPLATFLLEEYRPKANVRDAFGNTPLHYAVMSGLWERKDPRPVIQLLLRYGADVNMKNSAGFTPLHLLLREWKRLGGGRYDYLIHCAAIGLMEAGAYLNPTYAPQLRCGLEGCNMDGCKNTEELVSVAIQRTSIAEGLGQTTLDEGLSQPDATEARPPYIHLYEMLLDW